MTEISQKLHEMITENVKYESTEMCAFNGHKFQLVKIFFKTAIETKKIFQYDCSCGAIIKEFRVVYDTEKHNFECSCDTCMPPITRPPIAKYAIIESYVQIGQNEPVRVNRDIYNENFLRTRYPEWLREEYDKVF